MCLYIVIPIVITMKLHMYRILKERRPGHVRDSGAIEVTVESPVYA